MEFDFRLDEIFPSQVAVIDHNLVPKSSPGFHKLGNDVVRARVTQIIDAMGKASFEAQDYPEVITSAEKLKQSCGDQLVYLLLDFTTNQVVGVLKTGKKKLFVYDQHGVQHEVQPVCILDIYILEERQRIGCGHMLFEAMLENEGVRVEHLALDRPTDKLIEFLRTHYKLKDLIPQANNFAIFDGFFNERTDKEGGKKMRRPVEPETGALTMFEDSRDYNTNPALHLRNAPHHDASSDKHRFN